MHRNLSSHVSKRFFWFIQIILAITFFCFPANQLSAQSADEAKLREMTQAFFKSYELRDIAEPLRQWNAQSPNQTAYRQETEKFFSDCSKIELSGLAVRQIEWESQTAHVRVTLELNAIDAKTNQKITAPTRFHRVVSWRQENSEWKIWREVSAFAALAQKLLAANEQERALLLSSSPDLVRTELAYELNIAGNGLRNSASPNYALSTQAYLLAYPIALQVNDKSRAGTSMLNTSQNYYFQANYEEAINYSQRALQLQTESKNLNGQGDALTVLAAVHSALGHYVEAKSAYEQVLKIREEQRNPLFLADALNNIGTWHFQQGSYEASLENYQRALDLRLTHRQQNPADANNLKSIAELRGNIALSYVELGSYLDALKLYEDSLEMARSRGADDGDILNQIGALYRRQGNNELALEYYLKARPANEQQKKPRLTVVSLNGLGASCLATGQVSQSVDYHKQALVIAEQIKNPGVLAKTYSYLGAAQLAQKSYDQCLSNFQKGLEISRQYGLSEATTEACLNLALAHFEQKNLDTARSFADEATQISTRLERPDLRYRANTLAARIYQLLGHTEDTRKAALEAVRAIEQLRSGVAGGERDVQKFFEDKTVPYTILTEIALSQNHQQEALQFSESTKARVLLDVLQSGKGKITGKLTDLEQKQETILAKQLGLANSALLKEQNKTSPNQSTISKWLASRNKAQLDYEDFRIKLYAAHPELKIKRGEAKTLTLAEAGALLPDEKTALLEYVVTPERSHLFVVTKPKNGEPKLKVYPLAIKRDELATKVEQFRSQLAERDTRFGKLANELYGQLLKPAKADLPAQTRLVIVPDGPLWELPFQALLTEQNRYLLQDHVISYAPSLTVLREMSKVKREPAAAQKSSLLAFGDPKLGGQSLTRAQSLMGTTFEQLPEARTQVETLRKFYDANRSKVFIGDTATEEQYKAEAGNYDILHFATHGVLNDRNPLYSHLLLAQPETAGKNSTEAKEDGMLEAWEIMQMDLHADLAVLSACETARGKVGAGEGMIGLTWAMFVAGVPTTVVSQWKVRADSTADLMVEFHRLLQARDAKGATRWTRSEALQQAAMKLLADPKYRHPFYWAGFVLIGKP